MDRRPFSLYSGIKKLRRPVFTTHELAAVSGRSLSSVAQALNALERDGLVFKLYRGIWADSGNEELSPNAVIPYLFPRHRAYISFVSALHIYGIIEQIPQVITLASTIHTRVIRTKIGVFALHRISPLFFDGFGWYKGAGSFLIAEPEKALVDSLYLSACRKKQFGYFPELRFPKGFNFNRAREWAGRIPNSKIRSYAKERLESMIPDASSAGGGRRVWNG